MSDRSEHKARLQQLFMPRVKPLAAAPTLHDGEAPPLAAQARQPQLANKMAEACRPQLTDETLALMVQAAAPKPTDETLDVACGAGPVVAAFAAHVRRAVGLDAAKGMLKQAASLAREKGLQHVEFVAGNAYALPFADQSFDVVTCYLAFHHFEDPWAVLAEMHRVCRRGGRVVVCDILAPDDVIQALAFNKMERHRDPTTIEYLELDDLLRDFEIVGLPPPEQTLCRVGVEREALIAASFPANGDRARLRQMIDDAVERDRFGMEARREGDTVHLCYHAAILSAARTDVRPSWQRALRR